MSEQKYEDVFEYYKGLVSFRKEHAALRLSTSKEVQENVIKVEDLGDNVVGFNIKGGQKGESAEEIYLLFNANAEEMKVKKKKGSMLKGHNQRSGN